MSEKWIKWEPINGLSDRYEAEAILDNFTELKILLFSTSNNSNKIEFTFKNSIRAYRSTDESFWMRGLDNLDEQYGAKFYINWTFFKIINSTYIESLAKNLSTEALTHFVLFTPNFIIDIAATDQPVVEFIK